MCLISYERKGVDLTELSWPKDSVVVCGVVTAVSTSAVLLEPPSLGYPVKASSASHFALPTGAGLGDRVLPCSLPVWRTMRSACSLSGMRLRGRLLEILTTNKRSDSPPCTPPNSALFRVCLRHIQRVASRASSRFRTPLFNLARETRRLHSTAPPYSPTLSFTASWNIEPFAVCCVVACDTLDKDRQLPERLMTPSGLPTRSSLDLVSLGSASQSSRIVPRTSWTAATPPPIHAPTSDLAAKQCE